MATDDEEEQLLRSVAMQNADSIFLRRQRAEQELLRVREALELKSEALAESLARTEATLVERDRARAEAEAARNAAEAANDAKSRFLHMVSHELRTPLGAIGGYVALLSEGIKGTLGEEQLQFMDRIRHNQEHLLRLVNELLDLAKIESGQFPFTLGAIRLNTVLESVHTMIDPQLRRHELRLDILPVDDDTCFFGDGERVEQILLNLLSNAVKFTPPGGVITIMTETTDQAIEIRVVDTGVGIPPESVDAVFQPFFQVDSSPAHTPRGTGLGLAISREFARAMGGNLSVESELGRGSIFTLGLPTPTGNPGAGVPA